MHMDWFRNVPYVIRNQANQANQSADQHKQEPFEASSESQVDQTLLTLKDFSHKNGNINRISQNSIPEESLICPLCGEIFIDPRILPCLHSFCRRCIEYTINPRSTTLTCHLCRKETNLNVSFI